jgi:GTP-binding protein
MNLNNVSYVKGAVRLRDRPNPSRPEVVVIGRSNVGKSSLINAVLNRKNLARTSSTPGKTRLINYFNIDDLFYLVDLPGYGYIKKKDSDSISWDELLGDFLLKNSQVRLVLLLIDSRHPELDTDSYTINWLRNNHIPFIIILTKCDKLSGNQLRNRRTKIESLLPEIRIISFSTMTRTGSPEIVEILEQIASAS